MISLNIHPLFVFDGPNKPPFKRNKRTGLNVASIPEFLAKQLLKHFGFPMHHAPGEAEAECALLQKEGVVDAVLSEDVDTLMFGSKVTIRNWTSQDKGKTPTHVNLYNAEDTKKGSGLDREGMILVALMSGGDYVPQGIPGCGPKIACEAARAGFGHDLYKIRKNDQSGFQAWRERLSHELRTNESKFFRSKHGALKIPDDFPSTEILGYYTNPAISPIEKVRELQNRLSWDQDLDFLELRSFTGDAFDWRNFSGAKKFVRNLAQSLIIRELRLGTQSTRTGLVKGIHQARNHASTDGLSELRISYVPIEVVNIDLSAEPPDDEIQVEQPDPDELNLDADEQIEPSTQSAKSKPYLYDPTQVEKIWIPEAFVKVGEPTMFAEWENRVSSRSGQQATVKALLPKNTRGYKTRSKGLDRNKPKGALDPFLQVAKSTVSSSPTKGSNPSTSQSSKSTLQPFRAPQTRTFRPPPTRPDTPPQDVISLLSSSPLQNTSTGDKDVTPARVCDWLDLPATVTKRRKRSPMQRAHSQTSNRSIDEFFSRNQETDGLDSPTPKKRDYLPGNTPKRSKNTAEVGRRRSLVNRIESTSEILSSPSKSSIIFYFPQYSKGQESGSPEPLLGTATKVACLDLTMSPPFKTITSIRNVHENGAAQFGIFDEEQDQGDDHIQTLEQPDYGSSNDYPEPHAIQTIDLTSSSPIRQGSQRMNGGDKSVLRTQQSRVQQIESLDILKDMTTPVRRSPRIALTNEKSSQKMSGKANVNQQVLPPLASSNLRKKWVRVRKSLNGAFALEEHDSPQTHKKSETMWKMSDVKILDLS
jgi:holliday junction resolvase YEN1